MIIYDLENFSIRKINQFINDTRESIKRKMNFKEYLNK
jgi:hypothetical protein